MVKLTNEALKKSKQTTSKDLPSTISSLVSADGHTPCALLGGPMTDLFGQVLAPAKAIAPLANKKAAKTKGISGRHGAISLNSTTLQQSLASKLQERLPLDGLMKCSLIHDIEVNSCKCDANIKEAPLLIKVSIPADTIAIIDNNNFIITFVVTLLKNSDIIIISQIIERLE